MTYYTVKEIAEMLKCTEIFVYQQIKSGELEHHRLKSGMIRISQAQFDKYMGERCEG